MTAATVDHQASTAGGAGGAGAKPRRSRVPATASQYLLWGAGLVVIVGPLVPVAWASLWSTPLYEAGGELTLANYRELLTDPDWWDAVRNSVSFAVLTTTGSIVIGSVMAVLFTRTDLPGRRILGTAALLPVAVPGLPLILGWAAIYAPSGYVTRWLEDRVPVLVFWDLYSVPGMSMLAVGIAAPVVAMLVRASLASQDAALEMAARTAGASPLRMLATVTMPLLRPALLGSGLIVFALSLEVLGLPLILGSSRNIEFVSTYLYDQWLNEVPSRQGLVSAGAVALLAVVSLLLVARNRIAGDTARFETMGGKATTAAPIALGKARTPLFVLVVGYLVVVLVLPLVGLLLTAFTTTLTPFIEPWTVLSTTHFETVINDPVFSRSVTNSLLVAVIGAALATVAIAALSVVAHRSTFRFRGSLQYVMLYPRAIPGLVTGMAFFWAFVVLDPTGTARATLWAVGLAFAVRSLALGYSAFYPALAALGEDLDRAARTAGADWGTAMRTIVLRLLRPAMAVSFVLLFVAMLNDYDPAVFLVTPGTEVMGLTMLKLWVAGTAGPVAALGVIQVVVTFAVLGIGRLAFGVRGLSGAGGMGMGATAGVAPATGAIEVAAATETGDAVRATGVPGVPGVAASKEGARG